ncbi:MAG: hypothetical protein HY664_03395 [Chloroflexi bacterium]|nr:hypothetical protein [Chloroflexota bacterium]
MPKILLSIIAFLGLLTLSCGTANINFHTTVRASGNVTQEISMEGTGAMAQAIRESANPVGAKAKGWAVEQKETKDGYLLKMSRDFKTGDIMELPFEGTEPTFNYDVKKGFFSRTYEFRLKIPASEGNVPLSEVDGEFSMLGEALQKALLESFKFSWTLTLPGKITQTNADEKTETSATWYFPLDKLSQERDLSVESRSTNWMNIALMAGVITAVVVAATVGMFFLLRKRPASPSGED